MNKEMLKEYAELCQQIKELEQKKKAIQPLVLAHMQEVGVEKIQSPFGTFSINERTSYTYSEEVLMIQEELQFAKKEEEENGKATPKTLQFIRYQRPKV